MSLLTDDELTAAREEGRRSVQVVYDNAGNARYGSLLGTAEARAVERAVLAAVSRQCALEWDVGRKYVLAQIDCDAWMESVARSTGGEAVTSKPTDRCTQLTGCYGEHHDMRCSVWTTPVDVPSPKEQASNLRKAAGNDPGGPFAIDMIRAANTIEGLLAERDEARALLAHKSKCLTRSQMLRDEARGRIARAQERLRKVKESLRTVVVAARELRRIEIAQADYYVSKEVGSDSKALFRAQYVLDMALDSNQDGEQATPNEKQTNTSILNDDEHRKLLAFANRHLVSDDGTYADGLSRVEILDYGRAVEQATLAKVASSVGKAIEYNDLYHIDRHVWAVLEAIQDKLREDADYPFQVRR